MNFIQELIVEYTRMRDKGLDAKTTLHALRPYIEPLSNKDRAQLADYLHRWESDKQTNVTHEKSFIKPIISKDSRPNENLESERMKLNTTWVACTNCHTKSKIDEIFCHVCGHLIDSGLGFHNTRNFADSDPSLISPEYFSTESLLILRIRDSGSYFTLHPQQHIHEVIIGRSSPDNVMKPNIDLINESAETLGVSRLHLAIQYIEESAIIMASDLGSANGSFINGQKLHHSEERILRHGDELRMGHLIMQVEYQHPGKEIH